MSNSLDSFLTRIGDVTIERVNPRANPRSTEPPAAQPEVQLSPIHNERITVGESNQMGLDDTSDESSGEISDLDHESKSKNESIMHPEEIEEIHDEGSADDMDLDETIDSHIGVRMDPENRQINDPPTDEDDDDDEDDIEAVDILENLPLEGAPIEGQEVSEADLLGKPMSKEIEDAESEDNEANKADQSSASEGGAETGGKHQLDSSSSDSLSKKQKVDDGNEDSSAECESTKIDSKKMANMRRNIREVMDETQLDEATLAAQRQEMERLRRVQEQQRIIREVQRQFAVNRQSSKGQQRAVSLLQGKQSLAGTTIMPSVQASTSPSTAAGPPSQSRQPSTVLVKVNSGSGSGSTTKVNSSVVGQPTQMNQRRPIQDGSRNWERGRVPYQGAQTSISRVPSNRANLSSNMLQQRIRMMTPSVSISPVVPKKEPIDRAEYYTDSDFSDTENEEIMREKQLQTMRKLSSSSKPQKPPKGKELVTISSSSESSDDDCIVLSDPSGDEESDNEDDPANSGMHTNDRYNIPDEQGRVLVNVGHPESEPDVFLAPQVARIIKPHQIGGIRFLYDNIVESIERYKTSSGFGCILAHSMGLGKTLQVASFCDIFFRCTSARTVLCIMPINTLQNWLAEFNMWLPYEDPNAVKPETISVKQEPGLDTVKQEIKEEASSNISAATSTDSLSRSMTDVSLTQSNIPKDNTISPSFDKHNPMVGNYVHDGNPLNESSMNPNSYNIQQDPMYPGNVAQAYDPMKQEMDMRFGNEFPGMPYPDNRPVFGGDSMERNQQVPIYPNYDNSRHGFMSYPPGNPEGLKKEDIPKVKIEVEDNKKEMIKEELIQGEKKASEKCKTPYSVDAPTEMESRPRHFHLHILNDSHKSMTARARVITEWQKKGGVLMIGYELYRQLSLKKPAKAKRKRGQPYKEAVDVEEEDKNKGLLDEMHVALVNPGPDLVICDEGHRIKNSHASISLALKQIRTKRRIVLTGYPLQNNLLEYWCMVDFVRPNYLGTKSEFCNMFERPIQNGQCIDSTPQDIRLMRYRAHVLHALLEGFVQRRSHSVLQVSLPRKEEYIMLVRMTQFQRKLYDTFMNQVVKTRAVPNPLKAFAVCCKIWNHPDILYHFLRKKQANEEDDLDLEETIGEKPAPGAKRSKARQPKGESKKSKKASEKAVKNKPAASVQPNASASAQSNNATDTPAPEVTVPTTPSDNVGVTNNPNNKRQNFQNNYPIQNMNYPNNPQTPGNQQNAIYPPTVPQSQDQYSNFRPNEQSNYYPNEGNQEYNNFYNNNNQNQQRYGDQSFQQYPQNANQYNVQNSGQMYQNQSGQGYIPGERVPGGNNHQQTRYPTPAASGNEFNRPDHAQNPNYDQSGVFQRQGYTSYTERSGRNYNSNLNQGQNYQQQIQPAQQSNFPGQMPIQEYPPYNNQQQGFNPQNSQQTPNNAYNATANQNTNQVPQSTSNSYLGNQRTSGVNTAPSFTPSPTGTFPQNQQSGNVPIPQNYSQSPQGNAVTNASGFGQNQQTGNTQLTTSQQTHGYMSVQGNSTPGINQSQMRGYGSTTPNQSLPQAQGHGYGNQETGQGSGNMIHGYGQNPQQQNQVYQGTSQNSVSGNNYSAGGNNPVVNAGQTQRYPPQTNPQQQPQQQPIQQNPAAIGYTSNQQVPNSTPINQNDRMFGCSDQTQTGQNYPQNPNAPRDFSGDRQNINPVQNASINYPNNQNQNSNFPQNDPTGQPPSFKDQNDEYWQRNYQQPYQEPDQKYNDSYFRGNDPNSAPRYPGNYFPAPNYQNSSFDYPTTSQDGGKLGEDVKPVIPSRANVPVVPGSKESVNPAIQQSQKLPISANFPPTDGIPRNPAQPMNRTPQKSMDGIKEEKMEHVEKEKEEKSDEEIIPKEEEKDISKTLANMKDDPGIPYDWATELMKGYVPDLIDASAKMTLFFCILEEAIRLGDRVLAFSQSLFTLNLIEDFLARNDFKYPDEKTESWVKNVNYYRLDGSTSALEREKLINEFNCNPKIHLFLVSTRAGSLGINLVGANRAIVFDASWNPCHDTQAVCRVYRYGQQKKCYVYRLVTDNCLERKIYDRQISKQGMADRVVDQCNPDAHLSLKEATTLSWDWEEDSQIQDFSQAKDNYPDPVMHKVLKQHSSLLTKQPFHHESLLVDRKDKKLSQAEKRLARRGYELEKMAANCARPSYNYVPGNTATRAGGLQIRAIRGGGATVSGDVGPAPKPVASVRPMQQRGAEGLGARGMAGSRWIPAEVWQRQGMSAQEMTLPLDVVIPTNSPDKGSIVLKAGQRVMVLKSPKGIYMQLESGKIIAIRTTLKLNQQKRDEESRAEHPKKGTSSSSSSSSSSSPRSTKQQEVGFPLRNNSAISIIPKTSTSGGHSGEQQQQQQQQQQQRPLSRPRPSVPAGGYRPFDKEPAKRARPVATAAAKPYSSQVNLTNQVSLSRLPRVKQEPIDQTSPGESSNSLDGQVRSDQRIEEVRLEDVVAEVSPQPDYETSRHSRRASSDGDSGASRSSTSSTSRMFAQADGTNSTPSITRLQQEQTENRVTEEQRVNFEGSFMPPKEKDDVVVEEPSRNPTQMQPQVAAAPPRTQTTENAPVMKNNSTTSTESNVPVGVPPSDGVPQKAPAGVDGVPPPQREYQAESHMMPQGYPYGQYPRYYDYGDPRSRSLSNPYSSYYPPPPPSANARGPGTETGKFQQQLEVPKPIDDPINAVTAKGNVYQQTAEPPAKPPIVDAQEKPIESANSAMPSSAREDANVPTAFSHPGGNRYPGPYPPGPYDPYAQHYAHAPGSSTAYPPGGAPGYPGYGGPTYNADYARMYSAFHGPPPPATDPYIHHRGYAPPTTHPPNYYPPFPHPPYPNYSFLPPYPNPNMPAEPQPPSQ